mmetsp:Transcript_26515/g.40249  ORF Transcript_26515/g.40249 Transcript_26515/m.40249 type:complete len:97 (-) Transcript_26515:29-319(-)
MQCLLLYSMNGNQREFLREHVFNSSRQHNKLSKQQLSSSLHYKSWHENPNNNEPKVTKWNYYYDDNDQTTEEDPMKEAQRKGMRFSEECKRKIKSD